MKTILYQPLFINPQAYFVFPQLYHIERCVLSSKNLIQTYNVSGAVKLDFLNMEEVANFAGTIKFTNVV